MILPLFTFLLAHQQSEPSYPPLVPPTEEEHAKAVELWNLARKSHGFDRQYSSRNLGYFFQRTPGTDGDGLYVVVFNGSYAREHCFQPKKPTEGGYDIGPVSYNEFFNLPPETREKEERSQAIRILSYPASFLQLKPENITRPVDGYGFEIHREGITIRVFLNKGTNDVNRVQYQEYIAGDLKWITKRYFLAAFTYFKYYLPQAWITDDGDGNYGPVFNVRVADEGGFLR
ncbi:MAG: hypothetical protein KF836_01760 [Fimbriimonadaceae bacterium]|nr:hypothetical protein [Fimbriimonadaceae bacterium]